MREALIHAFNFEFINQTLNGGTEPHESAEAAALAWVKPDNLPGYLHSPAWRRFFALAAEHLDDGYFIY